MQKIRRKHLDAIVVCCLFPGLAISQAKSGLENYNQLGQYTEYSWMPILHYQSQKGLYTEFRYNYEEDKTASLFVGKTFEGTQRNSSYRLTPMLGFSAGTFKGSSLALTTEVSTGNWYISSQMQYSHSFNTGEPHFYFNWSEAGYEFSGRLFTGVAVQYTIRERNHEVLPGLLAGLNIGNFSIPLYFFHPFNSKRFYILGVNYQFHINRKKKSMVKI